MTDSFSTYHSKENANKSGFQTEHDFFSGVTSTHLLWVLQWLVRKGRSRSIAKWLRKERKWSSQQENQTLIANNYFMLMLEGLHIFCKQLTPFTHLMHQASQEVIWAYDKAHFILNKEQEYRYTSRNMDPRGLHLQWQMVTAVLQGLWSQGLAKWGRQAHRKHEWDWDYSIIVWDPAMINGKKIAVLVCQDHLSGAVFKLSDGWWVSISQAWLNLQRKMFFCRNVSPHTQKLDERACWDEEWQAKTQ